MAILAEWPEILPIFFSIFVHGDVFYFLVEFEDDWMSPDESTKNERKGAHWLNCQFF